jgi:hypothetical protein
MPLASWQILISPRDGGMFRRWPIRFLVLLACSCLMPLMGIAAPGQAPRNSQDSSGHICQYNMTGRVRLLLFWIGRENVGKGTVRIESAKNPGEGTFTEKIEVQFGTLPQRVPMGINRWGTGQETASWRLEETLKPRTLLSSQFVGFMRHSSEDSLSQVTRQNQQDKDKQQYWYDGIISTIQPNEATTEIYSYPLVEEISLEKMEMAREAFQLRRRQGGPNASKRLSNLPRQYQTPQGFLTCLHNLMAAATHRFQQNGEKGWENSSDQATYAYNARVYKLETLSRHFHRQFPFVLSGSIGVNSGGTIPNVAEIDYQLTNLASGERHRFSLWFPMSGPLQNIPLQIRDNPRWWLQVQLQLIEAREIAP